MFQALFAIVSGLLAIWRWLRGLKTGGGVMTKWGQLFLLAGFLKVIDLIGLGFVTYNVSDYFIQQGIQSIQTKLNELSTMPYGNILVGLVNEMMFPQALSVVFSAFAMAFTAAAFKLAWNRNFVTPA